MSLFGSDLPKMTYRATNDARITITFTESDAVQCEYNFNEPDYLINQSVITGKKSRIRKGEYHSFKLNIMELSGEMYNSLKAMNNSEEVYFYPHGNVSTCFKVLITRLQPYYNKQHFEYDACKLEMETEGYESI